MQQPDEERKVARSPPSEKSPQQLSPRSPEVGVEHEIEDAEVAAHQAENTIEPGDNEDFDDGYETDAASGASTSLSSSVRDYTFENGRRYHKFREGHYQFPVGSGFSPRIEL